MRKLLIFLIMLIHAGAYAQEGLTPLMPEEDTLFLNPAAERQLLYQQMLFPSEESFLLTNDFRLPEMDFNTALIQRWHPNFSELTFPYNEHYLFTGISSFYPSPFLRNAAVLSEGTYQLSDKFKIGGYSYGASSIFTAPLPHPGINNFDTRGASMFFQYKVSKNFKIETHINVQQGRQDQRFPFR